jgi:fructose-1-phosphate kinase PfkB-like protein
MKPNVNELEEISGYRLESEADIYEAAQDLNNRIQIVLVSAGQSGAYLVTKEGSWRGRLDLPQTSVLNTVGCGDCLLGGFISGAMAGLEFPESLRRGLAAAAANAQSEGVAQFQRCDFERLLQQARVEARI